MSGWFHTKRMRVATIFAASMAALTLAGCAAGPGPLEGIAVVVTDARTDDDGLRYTVTVTNTLDEAVWIHDYYGREERADGSTLRIVQEFGSADGEWTDGGPGGDPVATIWPGMSATATWVTTGDPLGELGMDAGTDLIVCVELVTESEATKVGVPFDDVSSIPMGALGNAPRAACSEPSPLRGG